jgi:hypothetical protein
MESKKHEYSIVKERFVLLCTIEKGGTSKVKLGCDMKTNQQVAVKILKGVD